MNDLDICTLVHALYSEQVDGFWDTLLPHDGGYVARKRIADKTDVVIWRGSETDLDWLEDLDASTIIDPRIGEVHAGFLRGVESVRAALDATIARPVLVAGHSLGAAHAAIYAGLSLMSGKDLRGAVLFGCPNPGYQRLANILAGLPLHSYRNGRDPVTYVPAPIFGFDYVPVRPFIQVDVEPDASDSWGLFAHHHIALYHTAMQAAFKPTLPQWEPPLNLEK